MPSPVEIDDLGVGKAAMRPSTCRAGGVVYGCSDACSQTRVADDDVELAFLLVEQRPEADVGHPWMRRLILRAESVG